MPPGRPSLAALPGQFEPARATPHFPDTFTAKVIVLSGTHGSKGGLQAACEFHGRGRPGRTGRRGCTISRHAAWPPGRSSRPPCPAGRFEPSNATLPGHLPRGVARAFRYLLRGAAVRVCRAFRYLGHPPRATPHFPDTGAPAAVTPSRRSGRHHAGSWSVPSPATRPARLARSTPPNAPAGQHPELDRLAIPGRTASDRTVNAKAGRQLHIRAPATILIVRTVAAPRQSGRARALRPPRRYNFSCVNRLLNRSYFFAPSPVR